MICTYTQNNVETQRKIMNDYISGLSSFARPRLASQTALEFQYTFLHREECFLRVYFYSINIAVFYIQQEQ